MRTVRTTTFVVRQPVDYARLEEHFKLVRYELPERLRWSKNNNDYGQMHNSLRDQIDFPYKTYKYDRLDGKPKWVVYVLYPHEATIQPITISFLSAAPLPFRQVSFADPELHILLKLLQIAYFRGEQAGRFIGQDVCYIYAKQKREHRFYICLRVDLQGDIRNQEGAATQEFKVIGRACPFKRVEKPNQTSRAYFGRRVKGGKAYFVHFKAGEVSKAVQAKEPVYEIRTSEGRRTTLNYHDQQHLDESVGKLLYDFIGNFTGYLANFGIIGQQKERTFQRFEAPKNQAKLPLEALNPIYVYDNRLQRDEPLQAYCEVFESVLPELQFLPIEDLTEVHNGAVLVVQDCSKEDFEEEGALQDWADPYLDLYQRYSSIPKQSININTNESATKTATEYLDYPLPQADDKILQQKLTMALSQLYLKEVILRERSVEQRLPLAPQGFVFIRKGRYFSQVYETLLAFERDHLRFVDLRDEAGRVQRDEILAHLGIDWDTMYDRMLDKHRKKGEEEDARDLSRYDVIIGPKLFVELENLNERVLYEYDEITKRQRLLHEQFAIDDLKLAARYDEICLKSLLLLSDLQRGGLLDETHLPNNRKEQESLDFYRQLEKYDALLEEIQRTRRTISFDELTQGELMERIADIFDIQADEKGRYDRRRFKSFYQRREMFPSDKESDLHMYQGIWYDTDQAYMVGEPLSLNQSQPRAHLIRRFDVYVGAEQFDIRPLLAAMSVQFVRLNRYTVYPYPFHLLDLYVESGLRFR